MIRKQIFAGSWYPLDSAKLEKMIKITSTSDNKDFFGVVPHAGLYYSASLIKLFFNTLSPEVNKMLLITPSHYFSLPTNVLGSGNIESFECSIQNIPGFSVSGLEEGYEKVTQAEHAVEMILPFIAERKNLSLCCAHVNQFSDINKASGYAQKLLATIDDKTAVLASSDFTHYGKSFGYTPYGSIINKDVVDKVSTYDINIAKRFAIGDGRSAYIQATQKDEATICGIAPMLIVSEMARLSKMGGRVLGQSNSIEGSSFNENSFVSYLSIAWRK